MCEVGQRFSQDKTLHTRVQRSPLLPTTCTKKRLSAKKENFDGGGGGGLLFDDEAKPTATTNTEEKERKNLSMRTDDIRPVNLRA